MHTRTAVAVVAVLLGLVGLAAFAVTGTPTGTLTEEWVSDTVRDNRVNHHAVGVGPEGRVIVAPVAEVPNSDRPLTDLSCSLVRLHPANGSVRWRTGLPAEDCFTHALTEPAVDDLDRDGTMEVIAATTQDAVVVLESEHGQETARIPLETYGYSRPTVADLDARTGREIVTSDIGGTVVAGAADGTALWRRSLSAVFAGRVSSWTAPLIADLDANGTPEIAVGTSSGLAVLSANGSLVWRNGTGSVYTAAGQADGDPAIEIAVADGATVRLFDGREGALQWHRSVNSLARLRTLADGDGDGTAELYLGLADGTTIALDAETGATEWTTTVSRGSEPVLAAPVIADIDGSDDSEVIVAARSGTVVVLDATSGTELAAYHRSVPIWTFPTPVDLDRDGSAEVLVRYGDGRVVALEYAS